MEIHLPEEPILLSRLKEHAQAFNAVLSMIPAKYYFTQQIDEKSWGKPIAPPEIKLKRMRSLDPAFGKAVPDLISEKATAESDNSDVDSDGDDASAASDGDDQPTNFQFSRVVTPSEMSAQGKRQDKQKLLVKAERLQEQSKRLKGTEAGAKLQQQHSWTNAIKRASGEKIRDDPARLKKSLKADRKRKERSQKDWAERKAEEQKQTDTRIERREENLKKRKLGKKGQSGSQKSRPGFEGKKKEFLNKKK
eukprot:TRINITY_DN14512_c0_g1_i1.p1 TRINITY_DN14512_c0_g1~~TRINITY_DN14512_c0_g1_i1.p1  ORF type:complete len:258 (+),score=40.25 TRINITY_DN14512_c0_g1_i1:27-776(+)